MRAVVLVVAALASPVSAETTVDRDTGFELAITAPTARPTEAGTLKLILKPTAGRKLNELYPFRIDIAAPADVRLAKTRLGRDDARAFGAAGVELDLAVTPKTAGDKSLLVEVRFAMCTDENCEPYRRSVKVPLRVR